MAAIFVCMSNQTYGVHEWPQSNGAVHAASRHHNVSTMVQAATNRKSPDREGQSQAHSSQATRHVSECVFVPHVGIHTVEGRRQLRGAAVIRNLYFSQALPLRREQ